MTNEEYLDSCYMSEKRQHRWTQMLKFISPVSFLVVLFILVVLYEALVDIYPPPIETANAQATAKVGSLATVIVYTRELTVNNSLSAVISRQLDCDGHPTYDFPESTRKYEEGSRTASRTLAVPLVIPVGTKCRLLSSYSYRPTLSLSWHHVKVPDISFTVEAL